MVGRHFVVGGANHVGVGVEQASKAQRWPSMSALQQRIGDQRVVVDLPRNDARRRQTLLATFATLAARPSWTLNAISSRRPSIAVDAPFVALCTLRFSKTNRRV